MFNHEQVLHWWETMHKLKSFHLFDTNTGKTENLDFYFCQLLFLKTLEYVICHTLEYVNLFFRISFFAVYGIHAAWEHIRSHLIMLTKQMKIMQMT